MRSLLSRIRSHFALLVILLTFLWACGVIVSRRSQETSSDQILIRLGHWQLETSVRDALNDMIREYQKLYPQVRIVQDAIPEMTYGQWLTTQLMGGTAPDIIEVGIGVPYPLLVQYLNRYFIPLTRAASLPNPYNAGTELENTPLRATFKDGMRSSWIDEVQAYMTIPLSQFGTRIFYNRDLLKELTGRESPPKEYRDFLSVCEEIQTHQNPLGQPYIPIACSRFHLQMWEWPMMDPLTYPLLRESDFNRDGYVGNDEMFVAVRTGRYSLLHPAIRARFKMLQELSQYFQTGYTGLTRDEAVFLFAQERAVFMTTGTWDARSLQEQAKGVFEVGIMDYPLPTREDPEYGPYVLGPNYERILGGFPFGITKTCKHPDMALDFLLYLAGRPQNERLNQTIGWIPSVKNTRMDPLVEAFQPHLQGVYGCFNPNLGGETWIKWLQLYSLFQVGQISFEDLMGQFEPFYKDKGLKDFEEQQKDWRRAIHSNEQILAGMRASALMKGGQDAESIGVRYRSFLCSRQLWTEIGHARQMKMVTGELPLRPNGPYEYSDHAIQRVKARLKNGS